jgi:hypothetical protein
VTGLAKYDTMTGKRIMLTMQMHSSADKSASRGGVGLGRLSTKKDGSQAVTEVGITVNDGGGEKEMEMMYGSLRYVPLLRLLDKFGLLVPQVGCGTE